MSGRKERAGKTRKFAPKRPAQKEAEAVEPKQEANDEPDGKDDPFAALMEQAKEQVRSEHRHRGFKKTDKFNVAFGAGALSDEGNLLKKVIKGDRRFKDEKGFTGYTKGSGFKGKTKDGKEVVGFPDDEEMQLMDEEYLCMPKKDRKPLFDRNTHYPNVIPFTPVDVPHDPDADNQASSFPIDLSEQAIPEPDAAEELGLTSGAPDGHLVMLQMPPILPSLPLLEDAQRAAIENPSADAHLLPKGFKPLPLFAKGHEVLRKIPGGKIGTVVVTKKGRVKLRIGYATYDVRPGVTCHHRSELAFVNVRTKDVVLAGADLASAVASLDLMSLLKQPS